MRNGTLTSKIFLSLILISGTIWFGSYFSKLFVSYQFFEPESMDLKQFYSAEKLISIFSSLLPLFIISIVSYISFLLLYITYLFIDQMKFRQYGWYFIITIIILVTAPFQIYLTLIDFKIINLLLLESFNSLQVAELLKKQLTDLNSFQLVLVFSYAAIMILLVFKPLEKQNGVKN